MEFAALKWWHWILIALVVGIAVGELRDSSQSEIHGNYIEGFGYFLGNQKVFEDALVAEVNGRRRFRDITVYPRRVDDGHGERKQVYLVRGMYYGGPLQVVEGREQGGWEPTCFIASVPYDPMIDFTTLDKPGGPDWSRTFRAAGLRPTVLDFLAVMHTAAGVEYRYAWWDQYPLLTSILASIVLLGICWPVVVNLLSFHRLTRPPEAKAMSLWRVRNRRMRSAQRIQFTSAGASDEATPSPPEPPQPADSSNSSTSSVAPLAGAPLDAIELPESPAKEFGAGAEDFYPTERHTPREGS